VRNLFAVIAFLTLVACDEGGVIDQTVQTGIRESAVQTCVEWIPQSDIAAAAGLKSDKLCACAADRFLEGKSLAEAADPRSASEGIRSAVAQCVSEIQAERQNAEPAPTQVPAPSSESR